MNADDSGRDAFLETFDVSRETVDRLDLFVLLLKKWNSAINLVSRSTLNCAWTRHIFDSAQVFSVRNTDSGLWLDIGSGGGFPGAVVAILAAEQAPNLTFTLVESDLRKATFLRAVSRETSVPMAVISERIEDVPPMNAEIISARALAPLPQLLEFADRHLKQDGQAIFQKGASYRRELQEALETWTFQSDECVSKTDDAAVILSLGDIRRV